MRRLWVAAISFHSSSQAARPRRMKAAEAAGVLGLPEDGFDAASGLGVTGIAVSSGEPFEHRLAWRGPALGSTALEELSGPALCSLATPTTNR
jgi:hypothetical protein